MEALRDKLGEVEEKVELMRNKLKEDEGKGKEVAEEDKIPKKKLVLVEEPFLRAFKAMSGKSLEWIPLFNGKMEFDLVMEWIEGMENYFQYEGISEAQRVKVAKSRLRGVSLTWWNFVQDERVKEGKKPITKWKGMVAKMREAYLPDDYEV